MSLNQRIAAAMTRIGGEIKAVRSVANSKYTKPTGGIPLSDLSSDLQSSMSPLAAPGAPGSGVFGGVKNPSTSKVADSAKSSSYAQATVGVDASGIISSATIQKLINAVTVFKTGADLDGSSIGDQDLIAHQGLNQNVKKMLKAGLRWEQEFLAQPGIRTLGGGPARMGIHIPYKIRLKGIRYQFETATTSGTTEGFLYLNQSTSLGAEASLSLGPNLLTQTRSGLDIVIPEGSRIDFFMHSIGSGTIGRGLYVSLWGEYDLDGVTL
ncbi:hypothetical protein SEA_RICKMORE_8 [Gordonia phage Rickmore]|uniref:Uncharacterized protein n=1 Tax=Gordonia phage Rickmore TaxID=2507854 RepID=A0A410TB38_9CAUD|nr:hypothetical protein HWC05_gp08 [Gordonia phage Rickmore]QAU06243.1 hypothetical protein SEA_RICKMORE_8 [Gordonia phage Rickmore]